MSLLQHITGKFKMDFFGLPIRGLHLLGFLSKTELRARKSDAHLYSLHITPFFSITLQKTKAKREDYSELETKNPFHLQNVEGDFDLKFYGLNNPLGVLCFTSKTQIRREKRMSNIYSLHITPFLSFNYSGLPFDVVEPI